MFSKDIARIGCTVAVFFGAYMLTTQPAAGTITTGYRLLLVIGGTVGIAMLGLPGRNNNRVPKDQSGPQPASKAETVPALSARPAWMGDPAGNRRRLMIIFAVIVVLAGSAVVFLLATRGEQN